MCSAIEAGFKGGPGEVQGRILTKIEISSGCTVTPFLSPVLLSTSWKVVLSPGVQISPPDYSPQERSAGEPGPTLNLQSFIFLKLIFTLVHQMYHYTIYHNTRFQVHSVIM